jgi:FG-GAP repeat
LRIVAVDTRGMVISSRLAAALVVVSGLGLAVPVGASALATPAVASASSRVPAAARAPIAAALRREAAIAPVSQLHQSTLSPTFEESLNFYGMSVAIAGDTIAVGAPGQMIGGNYNVGAVYVFAKGTAGWSNATQVAVLTNVNGVAQDQLGERVAMTGTTIVANAESEAVGSHTAQGAAYVFVKPAGGWQTTDTPDARLTASDGDANDLMGPVAISGDTVVMGAPRQTDGSHAMQGAVYVFAKPTLGWQTETQTAKLTSSIGAANDNLGESVAISGDTVYAGATGSVAITAASGVVFAFDRPAAGWADESWSAAIFDSSGTTGDEFGSAVAFSGGTLVVGADLWQSPSAGREGAVYVFTEPASGWPSIYGVKRAILTEALPEDNDGFGDAVAIAGNTIEASAFQRDVGAATTEGAAYLYTKPATGWASRSIGVDVVPFNGVMNDAFGGSVGLSGATAVFGSYNHHNPGKQSGAAYVFSVPKPTLTGVKQSHPSFTIGSRPARVNPKSHKGGTIFSFAVNDTAIATLAFTKRKAGHTVKEGKLAVAARTGTTRVYFDGVVSPTRKLAPGHYTVTFSAVNTGGSVGGPHLSFTVTAPKKKHHKH